MLSYTDYCEDKNTFLWLKFYIMLDQHIFDIATEKNRVLIDSYKDKLLA